MSINQISIVGYIDFSWTVLSSRCANETYGYYSVIQSKQRGFSMHLINLISICWMEYTKANIKCKFINLKLGHEFENPSINITIIQNSEDFEYMYYAYNLMQLIRRTFSTMSAAFIHIIAFYFQLLTVPFTGPGT